MKNKLVIIVLMLMFALALGAGVVAGKLSTRIPNKETPVPSRGTMSDALQLTADQRQKMQAIWENVSDTSHDCLAQAQRVQREQDDQLMKILTDDQKAQYAKLTQDTAGKIAVLDSRRKESFKKAVLETDAILNDWQRKTYDQIVKDRVGELPDGAWERP